MDSSSHNPLRGMLAALRAARRQPPEHAARHPESGEPNGLVDLLQNSDFLPAELREGPAVPTGGDEVYDDLPALEDDAAPSTSPARHNTQTVFRPLASVAPDSSDSEDEPPALESSSQSSGSRLSLRGSRSPSPRVTGRDIMAAAGETTRADAAGSSLNSTTTSARPYRSRAAPRRTPATSLPHSEDNEAGAESDGSMPTLRTVTDSEGDEDSYFDSESDWEDETDEFGNSEEDVYDVPRPPISPAYPPADQSAPSLPSSSIFDVFPDVGVNMDVHDVDVFQRFHDMLRHAVTGPHMTEFGSLNDPDPVRADILIAGLETVSDEFVRRYEKLRAADGQDAEGCAICRDDLLGDPYPGPESQEAAQIVSVYAALPFHPEAAGTVVAFPCLGKHLFHSDCLSQWLSRKTTCPSCRFDIDPHSLTVKSNRVGPQAGRRTRNWLPPQVECMAEWLDAEERAARCGVPRKRPEPVMPTYAPVPPEHHAQFAPAGGFSGMSVSGDTATSLVDFLSPPSTLGYDSTTDNIRTLTGLDIDILSDMREHIFDVESERREGLANTMYPPPLSSDSAPPRYPPRSAARTTRELMRNLSREPEFLPEAISVLPPVPMHVASGDRVAITMPPPEHPDPALAELLALFQRSMESEHMQASDDPPPIPVDSASPQFSYHATDLATLASHEGPPTPQAPPPPPPSDNPTAASSQSHGLTLTPAPRGPGAGADAGRSRSTAALFDEGDVPPPIQADPNRSLAAVAPSELEAAYMHAFLDGGLVARETGDAPRHQGGRPDLVDDID
ncbi:hypothetical protein C8Q77DRAFT_1158906 [Trametes polyzona]|nr:hypothetical protein C8Q77DRAFT_1158906 [Trametes polyzona]